MYAAGHNVTGQYNHRRRSSKLCIVLHGLTPFYFLSLTVRLTLGGMYETCACGSLTLQQISRQSGVIEGEVVMTDIFHKMTV